MLRLTEDTRAVAEIVAISEHVASLTAASAAFRLAPDVPAPESDNGGEPAVQLVDEAHAGDAAGTLHDIRMWADQELGISHIPAIWRALAHDPRLLEATWRKDRLILGAGTLNTLIKGCAALAVAEFRQSDYWIAYLTQYLRTACEADDRVLVEVAGAVMHYVSFNTIAHAMRLEAPFSEMEAADVAPGGRHEQLVPGVRRSVTSQSS